MAQLAAEGKFFAIRYRIRAGKVANPSKEFKEDLFEGKTCVTWLVAMTLGSHKVDCGREDDAAWVALHVLAEIQLKIVRFFASICYVNVKHQLRASCMLQGC